MATIDIIAWCWEKTAERILVEVRDRLDAFRENFDVDNSKNSIQDDAVLGLVSLGYKKMRLFTLLKK